MPNGPGIFLRMEPFKKKVLAIIPTAFCFGLQHITVSLFSKASAQIEPHFLITRWNNGEFEKLLKPYGFAYSFSWLGMFSRKMDWYNLRMSLHALSKVPKLYLDVWRLCKNGKPDILYFANHHELILLSPILRFIKKPVVCHMHDPAPDIAFQKKTFKHYGKRVNHFICISENVKDRLMRLGCDSKKITVIYNGVAVNGMPVKRTSNLIKEAGWSDDNFIIGITGQMTETKGHEDVLDAFETAYSKNNNIRLIIGGKLLEPLYSKLKEQIALKNLAGSIYFSGWQESVSEFYLGIDLFILASRHDEGYGLVVAEAMAYGKPVVITDSGGATEIVENGVSGFVVPKKNSNGMADKIIELSINSDLYNRMHNEAWKRVNEHFSIDVSAKKFSRFLYEFK